MIFNLIKYWFRILSNTDFECHQDNDFDSHQNNDLISHLVKIMISTDFWVSAQNDSQAPRWPSFKTMITFLQVFRHELKYLNYFKIVLGLCLYILVLHWCQSGWVGGGRWFEMRKIFLRYFTREWAITSASLTKCPFDVCNCVQNVKKYCFFANLWCWCYLRIDKFWIQITIWWWLDEQTCLFLFAIF